jgi:cell wall-associated NlpC family hydrolase
VRDSVRDRRAVRSLPVVRRWGVLGAAVLLVAGLAVPTATAAPAAPAPAATSKPPLADDISAARTKLAALAVDLDVADENYRNGQLALQKAKLNQAAAQRRLQAGKDRRAQLQSRVDQIAVLAYQTGGVPGLLMVSPDGGTELAESTAVLSQFAADQDNTLSAAAAAQYDLAVAQTAAGQSAAATARSAAELAAAKAAIARQVQRHKDLIDSLVTRQHTLEAIAAEKARLARIAAAKAAAEKQAAARKAAEEAAAAALAEARKAAAQAAAAKAAAEQEAAQRAADRRRAAVEKAAAARKARETQLTSSATSSGAGTTDGSTSGTGGTGGTVGGTAGPPSSRAATAVAAAYRQLGDPYDWAADGPGSFDCSGLTAFVWAAAGVTLPHSSQAQFDVGSHVSRGELAPGDLVFFGAPIHHVGIYVGNGQMIDAPQTGDVVRVQSIDRSDYTGAVRVTG